VPLVDPQVADDLDADAYGVAGLTKPDRQLVEFWAGWKAGTITTWLTG
jgi:hypothetical protein